MSGAGVDPAQFYTGLIAELYEPLVGERARADDYVGFLERTGTPALELACGGGEPLLDLLERGFEVEGLDSSDDMLALCRTKAAQRGLSPVLHRGSMQAFDTGRRYRSIFLAGASFTLLTTDDDALGALRCMYAHLEPGGRALVPLEAANLAVIEAIVGQFRETQSPAGDLLRVGFCGVSTHDGGRNIHQRLRYERHPAGGGAPEIVERTWERRIFDREQFQALVAKTPFGAARLVDRAGSGPGTSDLFVAILARPEADGQGAPA